MRKRKTSEQLKTLQVVIDIVAATRSESPQNVDEKTSLAWKSGRVPKQTHTETKCVSITPEKYLNTQKSAAEFVTFTEIAD